MLYQLSDQGGFSDLPGTQYDNCFVQTEKLPEESMEAGLSSRFLELFLQKKIDGRQFV